MTPTNLAKFWGCKRRIRRFPPQKINVIILIPKTTEKKELAEKDLKFLYFCWFKNYFETAPIQKVFFNLFYQLIFFHLLGIFEKIDTNFFWEGRVRYTKNVKKCHQTKPILGGF